jgi:hypothetical protein
VQQRKWEQTWLFPGSKDRGINRDCAVRLPGDSVENGWVNWLKGIVRLGKELSTLYNKTILRQLGEGYKISSQLDAFATMDRTAYKNFLAELGQKKMSSSARAELVITALKQPKLPPDIKKQLQTELGKLKADDPSLVRSKTSLKKREGVSFGRFIQLLACSRADQEVFLNNYLSTEWTWEQTVEVRPPPSPSLAMFQCSTACRRPSWPGSSWTS